MKRPYLLFSDKQGKIYSHPYLRAGGSLLKEAYLPKQEELIFAPSGTTFFYLPNSFPLGFNPDNNKLECLRQFKGKRVYGVTAFLPPSYLRLYNPLVEFGKLKKCLPLWAYTACGFWGGKFVVTAKKVDKRIRQAPGFYNNILIKKAAQRVIDQYPDNRVYAHLFNCALNYNCLAAKNLFLQRWEAPLPVARFCNARCIGCLSYQGSKCSASHQRINFKPQVSEVTEVMFNHLNWAKEAIVSFGQGCEGEPLLEADLIAESIRQVRQKTKKGTININTNASIPEQVEKISKAGADSFRVSLNSLNEKFYNLYFKPKSYKFLDVFESIKIAKRNNKFVSLNLFIFPGFSDAKAQVEKLVSFLRKNLVDMIQWRNLNIDPAYFIEEISSKKMRPEGVLSLVERVRKEFPKLKTGYFNLPKEKF